MSDLTQSEFDALPESADTLLRVTEKSLFAQGLRQAAEVAERMKAAGFDHGGDTIVFCAWSKEDFQKMARALGSFTKSADSTQFKLTKALDGNLKVVVVIPRSSICARKVIGTKMVPEVVIPAHTEEIIEWECTPSILDGAATPAVEAPPQTALVAETDDIPF
jgi:hypothetical protein